MLIIVVSHVCCKTSGFTAQILVGTLTVVPEVPQTTATVKP